MRTIDWIPGPRGKIALIDQTQIPARTVMVEIETVDELITAIQSLAVRGAPALGVAGALGTALAVQNDGTRPDVLAQDIARLRKARPTAVNLSWGVDQAAAAVDDGLDAVLTVALKIRDTDIAACNAMAKRGADLLDRLAGTTGSGRPLTIMTICNTGALAAVETGTALGVVIELHRRGHIGQVIACETRPLLQGARLTAWELAQARVPYRTIVDSAANAILSHGSVDAVIVGADRIAANGDTANKIGTFSLSLGARYADTPFIVAAPETTIDFALASGSEIEIEGRGTDEVVVINNVRMSPAGTESINPAFDVTPASHISYIVTDARTIDMGKGGGIPALRRMALT